MSDIVGLLETVEPSDVPARAGGQRARTSQPVLDAFVASGQVVQRIPASALEVEPGEDETVEEAQTKRAKSLLSSLSLYATNHKYPVKVFSRGGSDVYLRRRDLDDEGNTIPWTPPEPKKSQVAENGADDIEDEEYETDEDE